MNPNNATPHRTRFESMDGVFFELDSSLQKHKVENKREKEYLISEK